MADNPLPKTEDERYDWPHIRTHPPHNGNGNGSRLAIIVAVGSLLLSVVAGAIYVGRTDERITTGLADGKDKDTRQDQRMDHKDVETEGIKRENNEQSKALAAFERAYIDHNRRIENLEREARESRPYRR